MKMQRSNYVKLESEEIIFNLGQKTCLLMSPISEKPTLQTAELENKRESIALHA